MSVIYFVLDALLSFTCVHTLILPLNGSAWKSTTHKVHRTRTFRINVSEETEEKKQQQKNPSLDLPLIQTHIEKKWIAGSKNLSLAPATLLPVPQTMHYCWRTTRNTTGTEAGIYETRTQLPDTVRMPTQCVSGYSRIRSMWKTRRIGLMWNVHNEDGRRWFVIVLTFCGEPFGWPSKIYMAEDDFVCSTITMSNCAGCICEQ